MSRFDEFLPLGVRRLLCDWFDQEPNDHTFLMVAAMTAEVGVAAQAAIDWESGELDPEDMQYALDVAAATAVQAARFFEARRGTKQVPEPGLTAAHNEPSPPEASTMTLHPKVAAAVARRRTAGESWASLAADFDLTEAQVRAVCSPTGADAPRTPHDRFCGAGVAYCEGESHRGTSGPVAGSESVEVTPLGASVPKDRIWVAPEPTGVTGVPDDRGY